jgi:hypothetical protein
VSSGTKTTAFSVRSPRWLLSTAMSCDAKSKPVGIFEVVEPSRSSVSTCSTRLPRFRPDMTKRSSCPAAPAC